MGETLGFVTRTVGGTNDAMFGITSGTPQLSRNQVVATKGDGQRVGEPGGIEACHVSGVPRGGREVGPRDCRGMTDTVQICTWYESKPSLVLIPELATTSPS